MGDLAHTDFGIAHGSGRIPVNRTKVALTIHQHITQGKWLGHAHYRFIYGGVAMGMVLTDHITHYAGRLFVGLVPVVVELVHGE